MSRQTKLSKLAIAAAALLTASVPCLAQNDLNKTKSDTNNVVAVVVSHMPKDVTASAESTTRTSSDVAVNETSSTFSAAKFMNAAKQSVKDQALTATATNSELRINTWEAPRVDTFAAPKKSKSIEFIPSRGQRLPDNQ